MAGRHVHAPWSPEQVAQLNRFQSSGVMHPFTCQTHGGRMLVATVDGWVCRKVGGCGYTQDWAHAFMADEDAISELIASSPWLRKVK